MKYGIKYIWEKPPSIETQTHFMNNGWLRQDDYWWCWMVGYSFDDINQAYCKVSKLSPVNGVRWEVGERL